MFYNLPSQLDIRIDGKTLKQSCKYLNTAQWGLEK